MLATVNDLQKEILKHCTDNKRDIDDLSTLCNTNPVLIECEIRELLREGKLKELPDPMGDLAVKSAFYSCYIDNTVYLTIKD